MRFHPACPFGSERSPTLIGLFRDIVTNAPRAIQRIRLTHDGQKIERRTLGPSAGACVKLDPDAHIIYGLVVGEGVETCLAARQSGLAPAWAAGGTATIGNFLVLNGIESLTLLAEKGEASAKAIAECGNRLA